MNKTKYSSSNECIQFIKDGLMQLSEKDRLVVLSHRESFELIQALQMAVEDLQRLNSVQQKPVAAAVTQAASTAPAKASNKVAEPSAPVSKPTKKPANKAS